MEILNSEWLIAMLKKSGGTPNNRLLHLFDVLDDWLDAPHLNSDNSDIALKPTHNEKPLVQFLAIESAKAGAAMPELLANQLYFMAIAAAQEKLLHHNKASMIHAKNAARALIAAQTKREILLPKKSAYAIAASTVILMSGLIGYQFVNSSNAHTVQASKAFSVDNKPKIVADQTASPAKTAALFARVEQMRKGDCQLVEALQLPESYKKVYFENVVLGQISTNPEEQILANKLLDMVRCNYTPMLMANSKS